MIKFNTKIKTAIGIALIAPLTLAGVKEKIRFAPGTSGAVMEGSVIRGDRDVYTLSARPNQEMNVDISSGEGNAVFQIYGKVDGSWKALPGAGEDDDATAWSDTLPESKNYKIVVGTTRGGADYSLTVRVK